MATEALLQATVGVLTVSDRASSGEYEDRGGPALDAFVHTHFVNVRTVRRTVPDEQAEIEGALRALAESCCLVLTTGGTGPAPRDVTPEATESVCNKMLPGFGERMRYISADQVPTAILSRQTAGILGSTLIVNLPGSPRAIPECMNAVLQAVPHAVRLAGGQQKLLLRPEFHMKGRDCKE
eukprot:IDg14910t1